jgi:hypothetical protein
MLMVRIDYSQSPSPCPTFLSAITQQTLDMIPSSKTLRSPEGDNGINCIDNYVQHSPTESDAPSIDLIPVIRTGPAFGPFASTLKKEHDDLSEQVLRDLSRHKVSRELSETIFTRLKTEAPTTANFNLDNIPTHPDLVGSVSTCSETSMFGLHSRQNSDGFAAGDVEGYEQGTYIPLMSSRCTRNT